jgi:methanogenic corrinoid protein MtbC1
MDLGTDVSAEKFVETVREYGADILAMSALLTTTMPQMKTVIGALGEAGLRDRVKVMIGGAPLPRAMHRRSAQTVMLQMQAGQ